MQWQCMLKFFLLKFLLTQLTINKVNILLYPYPPQTLTYEFNNVVKFITELVRNSRWIRFVLFQLQKKAVQNSGKKIKNEGQLKLSCARRIGWKWDIDLQYLSLKHILEIFSTQLLTYSTFGLYHRIITYRMRAPISRQ